MTNNLIYATLNIGAGKTAQQPEEDSDMTYRQAVNLIEARRALISAIKLIDEAQEKIGVDEAWEEEFFRCTQAHNRAMQAVNSITARIEEEKSRA